MWAGGLQMGEEKKQNNLLYMQVASYIFQKAKEANYFHQDNNKM
jgi:hypothetical protein